jgi:Cysteine rich repeat
MRIDLMRVAMLVGLWMLALQPSSASANDPCAADTAKFCAGVQKGGARVVKCLADHTAQLSDTCKAHLARIEAQREVHKACAADTQKFCKGVNVGDARVAKCLEEHEASLSAECKKARAAFRQTRMGEPEPPAAAANH